MQLTNNIDQLPVWFKSPLDQLNIRNFSSNNSPTLAERHNKSALSQVSDLSSTSTVPSHWHNLRPWTLKNWTQVRSSRL